MTDTVALFRDRLQRALDDKEITKAELHRKTGIARPTIDSYLAGAEPGLRAVGKIADVLGWQIFGAEAPPAATPIDAGELGDVIGALIAHPEILPDVRTLLGLPADADGNGKRKNR